MSLYNVVAACLISFIAGGYSVYGYYMIQGRRSKDDYEGF